MRDKREKRLGNLNGFTGGNFAGNVYDDRCLSPALNTMGGGGRQPMIIVAMRGRNPQDPSDRRKGIHLEQRLEPNQEGICNTLTTVQKDNLVMEKEIVKVRQATKKGYVECEIGGVADTFAAACKPCGEHGYGKGFQHGSNQHPQFRPLPYQWCFGDI